ncbi:phosphoglycolate phosphatase [Dictyobacter alpinus]|uniref:Phosphoglycolate phosphatase n=1 Tax=Dictyobacter alpinus TaxID=2014873 RepID=A0A402B298_9CHLR|nr:HAD hydrolase-like protein [Dictyobacter alpinus]GCE25427.1 phosphoglycolate phosphatase [Dictyobacter alpinus]
MHIKGFLFDLDGTLANTLPLCIKIYQQTFQHFTGRRYSDDEVTAHFGLTEGGICQRVIPEHWQQALAYYHQAYEQAHDECAEPFAGIIEVLQLLRSKGVRMAVVTGKGEHTANFTLKRLGIAEYFEYVAAGKEDAVIKATAMRQILRAWKMDPQEAAYIGDAASDVEQSAEAGVLPLAAEWAETATIHLLKDIHPYANFTSVEDFMTWITLNIETITTDQNNKRKG